MSTIKEPPLMISTSSIWRPSNGVSPRQREIPQSPEEDISPAYSLKRISSLSSEVGTSSFNSTTSSSMISKLKHGLIQRSATRSPSGTWEVFSLLVSPHGNTSSSEEPQETSSRAATELPASMRTTYGTSILTT